MSYAYRADRYKRVNRTNVTVVRGQLIFRSRDGRACVGRRYSRVHLIYIYIMYALQDRNRVHAIAEVCAYVKIIHADRMHVYWPRIRQDPLLWRRRTRRAVVRLGSTGPG